MTADFDVFILLRTLFIAAFLLTSFMFFIFTWIGVRRVQLLHRMVNTPLGVPLAISAFLFFLCSVGTLVLMLLLWIVPLF